MVTSSILAKVRSRATKIQLRQPEGLAGTPPSSTYSSCLRPAALKRRHPPPESFPVWNHENVVASDSPASPYMVRDHISFVFLNPKFKRVRERDVSDVAQITGSHGQKQ